MSWYRAGGLYCVVLWPVNVPPYNTAEVVGLEGMSDYPIDNVIFVARLTAASFTRCMAFG